jgi:glucokinase
MSEQYTIGIDLGGTFIKGGICDASAKLVHKDSISTEAEQGFEHVVGRMGALVNQLLTGHGLDKSQVAAIGVGAPGPMSHAKGMIYGAPNLPGFVNVPLRDRFAEVTGLTVDLENDANAAAFGEFTAGAAHDADTMVMLTLGTGIGGGVVLHGKLWRGVFDNAGEVGHMIIVPHGRPCPCGQKGCLERYGSAAAVADRLREAVDAGEDSVLKGQCAAGGALDARDVESAARAGDALAQRIWDETCTYLALAIVNLQHLINPEVVVLAGGLINAGDRLLDPLKQRFREQSWKIAPDHPQIRLATLGTDAGTIGAAMLSKSDEAT